MTFDVSRFRFAPVKDFLGVVMQQGRVQLDSDWNEWLAEFARRVQAGTLDTLGRAVVPRETPDGFRVQPSAGALTIGRGRMYVDGLLAENHGPAPYTTWDPRLAELRGTGAVSYALQPYYPNPPALPTGGGPHLVYLDVWQREVTHLHDPSLVEQAVGVDTTGRLQTVWQVKVLANVGTAATCASPDEQVPGWAAATAPSAGRLTTGTADVLTDPDPCHVPPGGGYKGLENQLYRVEIHDGGTVGQATFKWSRDNGAVATAVQNIGAARDRLVVESTGRDAVLRFSDGDWVEVTDDHRELHGLPGEVRRIRAGGGVDDATRTITLESPLTAGLFPTNAQGDTDDARHTRIRRWDQRGKVLRANGTVFADLDLAGATGLIPVPPAGTTLLLENGVVVSFTLDPGSGRFRVADAWSFAARTADASVEVLQAAPPRTIHHHYARLALVTFPSTVVDCRTLWPPDFGGGCCTEVVRPGESIQAALDRLPAAGGCVCLKTGVHVIRAPIVIRRSRITLHGETIGAIVRGEGTETLIRIGGEGRADDVTIADLRLEADEMMGNQDALVHASVAYDLTIRGCWLGPAPGKQTPLDALAIRLSAGSRAVVEHNTVSGLLGGVLGYGAYLLQVRDNHFQGPTAIVPGGATVPMGAFGVQLTGYPGWERVERNRFENYLRAVQGGHLNYGTVVAGNQVLRSGAVTANEPVFAIDLAGFGAVVTENELEVGTPLHGGVRVGGPEGRVEGNVVRSSTPTGNVLQENGVALPFGILVQAAGTLGVDGCRVAGNRLTGPMRAITVEGGSAAERIVIVDNQVEGNEAFLAQLEELVIKAGTQDALPSETPEVWRGAARFYGIRGVELVQPLIARNHLAAVPLGVSLEDGSGARVEENVVARAALGVVVSEGSGHTVSANRLDRQAVAGVMALGAQLLTVQNNEMTQAAMGVIVGGCWWCRVTGNRIVNGGYGVVGLLMILAEVRDNQLTNLRRPGILVMGYQGLACTGNTLFACGYAGVPLAEDVVALGIMAMIGGAATTISGCEVAATGISADGKTNLAGPALEVWGLGVDAPLVHGNRITGRARAQAHPLDAALMLAVATRRNAPPAFAQVADNVMSGAGRTLASVHARDITFSDNRCDHAFRFGTSDNPSNFAEFQGGVVGQQEATGAVVLIAQRALSVVGNQVHPAASIPAFQISGEHLSATGNVTATYWNLGVARVIPTPPEDFNVIGGL